MTSRANRICNPACQELSWFLAASKGAFGLHVHSSVKSAIEKAMLNRFQTKTRKKGGSGDVMLLSMVHVDVDSVHDEH